MPLVGKALTGTGSVLLGMQNPFACATEQTLATRSIVRVASAASLVSVCTRLSHMVPRGSPCPLLGRRHRLQSKGKERCRGGHQERNNTAELVAVPAPGDLSHSCGRSNDLI